MSDVTRILSAVEQGDPHAAAELLPLVYDELRRLAAQKMAQENPGQTLQATALVHEAYVRLVDVDRAQHWNSRGHFFAAAAEAMRRILVEKAREKMALKRGAPGNGFRWKKSTHLPALRRRTCSLWTKRWSSPDPSRRERSAIGEASILRRVKCRRGGRHAQPGHIRCLSPLDVCPRLAAQPTRRGARPLARPRQRRLTVAGASG